MSKKTREEIIESLKLAEMEEGRSGLVDEFLVKNPEAKKEAKKER